MKLLHSNIITTSDLLRSKIVLNMEQPVKHNANLNEYK